MRDSLAGASFFCEAAPILVRSGVGGYHPAMPITLRARAALPLLLAGLLAALTGSIVRAAAPPSEAVVIARDLYQAMGGQAGFDQVRLLQFQFAVSRGDTLRPGRSHWWDRFDGRYRVQARTRDGQDVLVLFNVQTRQGRAWVDGVEQTGEALKPWLERGYGWFINDTYWLLMPAKLLDPGVLLAVDGEARVGEAVCDRVRLNFDGVGLTPGDSYWAYVDRDSHLMLRWGFVLEGDKDKPGVTESHYDWVDWRQVGPIRLSTRKVRVDDPNRTAIVFSNLHAGAAGADSIFTTPNPIHP